MVVKIERATQSEIFDAKGFGSDLTHSFRFYITKIMHKQMHEITKIIN